MLAMLAAVVVMETMVVSVGMGITVIAVVIRRDIIDVFVHNGC